MTPLVPSAAEPVVINVVPAQKQAVKVRPDALHKLQLPPGPPVQAVGLKKGKNLLLRFADQGELLLEDFFDPASGQAPLELVSQTGEPLLLQPNSAGIALAEGEELVYVYGDRSTLGAWLAEEPGFNAALQEVFGSNAAQEWAAWIAPSAEAGGLVAVAPLAFGPIAGGVGAGALAAAAAGGGGGTTGNNNGLSVTPGAPSATLVEDGGVANTTAGTASATIALTTTGVVGTTSFDATYLTANGWSTADAGATYTKAGTYGNATLTIASGVVSYALDNSSASTQALSAGQSVTDSFTVQVTDGSATAAANAVFAINGSNDAPTVTVAATNQAATRGVAFLYQLPAGTFTDVDSAALTYSATQADGAPLPTWLSFNATDRTFSGTPGAGDGVVYVQITASDGSLTAFSTFTLNVGSAPVATDNIVNNSEAVAGFAVSGSATALVGQTVSVWVSGNPSIVKTATVSAGSGGQNTWQASFTKDDLPKDADGNIRQGLISFDYSMKDADGNEVDYYGDEVTVDTVAETPSITSLVPTELNLSTLSDGKFTVGGDVAEDGTITVAWKDSKGTVLLSQTSQAADGIWSLSFNAGDIPKGEVALSMSFADAHQNSATDVVSLSVLALNAKLQGSSGADTFGFKDAAVSGSAYAIEKFNLSEGDRLHISDLLTGFSVGVSDLSKWVSLATDAPNNKAVLTIDIDGAGAGIAQHEIYLQSTDLGALTLAALISDAVIY